jgi:serine protease Do
MAKAIITDGRVRHAWLGVGIGDIKNGVRLGDDGEPEQKQEKPSKGVPAKGAWVSRVMPNSPADKAGVHVGDVITQIDGQKIEGAADVVDYVAGQKVGAKLTVALLREGKASKSQVTLAELPANPYAMSEPQVKKEKIGVHLQTLTPEMASALGLAPDARGAVVTDVEASSVAAKAGLQPEDLIVEVDRKQVAGADEAAAALHASGKATHLLKVLRAGAFLFVTVAAQ